MQRRWKMTKRVENCTISRRYLNVDQKSSREEQTRDRAISRQDLMVNRSWFFDEETRKFRIRKCKGLADKNV